MSAAPSDSRKSMNVYQIFRNMVEFKERVKNELNAWKWMTKSSDPDYFDKLEHNYRLQYFNCKVGLYSIVYSKIKDLK